MFGILEHYCQNVVFLICIKYIINFLFELSSIKRLTCLCNELCLSCFLPYVTNCDKRITAEDSLYSLIKITLNVFKRYWWNDLRILKNIIHMYFKQWRIFRCLTYKFLYLFIIDLSFFEYLNELVLMLIYWYSTITRWITSDLLIQLFSHFLF